MLSLLFMFVGLTLLLIGCEITVNRAQTLARRLNVSELIIGLTIVSMGSNLPEISTAIKVGFAERAGIAASGIAVGNIIGSTLVNVTLVVGICAVIATLRIDKSAYRREASSMLLALLFMFLAALDGRIVFEEALFLCTAYVVYLLFLGRVWSRAVASDKLPDGLKKTLHLLRLRPTHEEDLIEEKIHHPKPVRHDIKLILLDVLFIVGGLVVVVAGSDLMVIQGERLARSLGLHTVVIGVLLGLGTSLPEMTIAMKSMRRGADGLILGNLMGSNILDPLMAIGGGALIAPLTIDRKVLFFEFPFLIVGTLMALLLLRERDDLDRYEGISLILFYLLFLFMSIFTFAFA